jgi:hypothetical protein
MEPTVEKIYKMCVPDEHYDRIVDMLKDCGRIGTYVTHKNGNRVRFYKIDGKIFADERKEDNSIFTQEVIKMSEVQQTKMEHSDFRKEMLSRIEKDKPELQEEEKNAMADVLYEANESIKKLIASGVHPALAKSLIEAVLNDKDIIDGTKGSPEALAEVLMQRGEELGSSYENEINES